MAYGARCSAHGAKRGARGARETKGPGDGGKAKVEGGNETASIRAGGGKLAIPPLGRDDVPRNAVWEKGLRQEAHPTVDSLSY